MTKDISAKNIQTIQMQTSGRMTVDMTLYPGQLTARGKINGNQGETKVNLQGLYKFLAYIEGLKLENTVVPPGKPPRGTTQFIIHYKDGESVTLGMNLNKEGLSYYELSPSQFTTLNDLWMNM